MIRLLLRSAAIRGAHVFVTDDELLALRTWTWKTTAVQALTRAHAAGYRAGYRAGIDTALDRKAP